jgi:predicted amidophosphoribosyltransferase
MSETKWKPRECPDCSELIEDEENWCPEMVGSGNEPGVCQECAEYYRNREDEFNDEFESSLQSAEAERDELDFEHYEED